MAMWIEFHLRFDEAMIKTQSETVRRFLELAAWCVSEHSGSLPNDTSTAAAVAFYEHLPQKREYWQYFPKWFTRREFEQLLPVFSYHLGSSDIAELNAAMRLLPNKPLVPTRNGEAPLLAAQRRRWAT